MATQSIVLPRAVFRDSPKEDFVPLNVPESIEGKRIAFLGQWKPFAVPFMASTEVSLREHATLSTTPFCGHPNWAFTHPQRVPLIAAEADAIAKDSDLMVTGVGDCGGCTVWVCQAAVEFEARGIPSVVLVTDVFGVRARQYLAAVGRPHIPVIETPNPVVYLRGAELKARTDELVEPIIAALTTPR